jgi:hypothetical protein
MLRKRNLRRFAGALLVLAGGLTMWLAPESVFGAVLLAGGIALEALGLHLERRAARTADDHDAVEP